MIKSFVMYFRNLDEFETCSLPEKYLNQEMNIKGEFYFFPK